MKTKSNFINERLSVDMNDLKFYDGLAKFERKGKWNYITKNGDIICNDWFDEIESFKDGFAVVKYNNKFNYINKNGEYLSTKWFDWADTFCEGFGRIKYNGKYNYITPKGKILSDEWFDGVLEFFREGIARVQLKHRYNLINAEGKLVSDIWFYSIGSFTKEKCLVKIDPDDRIEYRMKMETGELYLNGEWKKIKSKEDIKESYISLKDFILEQLNKEN